MYLLARGLPGIITFLAIPTFTRLLLPAEYGRYALLIATVSLLNSLLFQWLSLSLVRYRPVYRDDLLRLKSALATAALTIIAVLGLMGLVLSVLPIAGEWRSLVLPCWVLLAAQVAFDLSCENARASIRPRRYMALMLTRSVAMVGLGVSFVLLGAGWKGPAAGLCVGMVIAFACVARSDWGGVRLIYDRETLARLCAYGVPLSMTVALAAVIFSSDRFLIAWKLGEGSAGLYSVAVDFTAQTLTLLMMAIQLAMFPLAVRAFETHGVAAARDQMRSNASLLLAVGVPCVVGMALLAPGIAQSFFGKEFRAAASGIIPVVAIGMFLAGMKAYHFDAAFQFAHRTIEQVWIVLFVAVVNFVLNWFTIPRFGINGAACATAMAYAISILLTICIGRRHFPLPFPVRVCAQVVLAAVIMAIPLYLTRGYRGPAAIVAQVAGGAAIYAAILVATNFLQLRDQLMQRIREWRAMSESSAGPISPVAEAP
jgi:O-antigen/teichoic acid export membrane protein